MKKVLVVIFSIGCLLANGQPVTQRGSNTITVQDARLSAQYNLFLPKYSDTLHATAEMGIDSCGAIIFTYDNNNIWKRACSPKRWVVIGTGSVSGLDSIYVKFPLGVYTDATGHQVIYTRLNGLINGGVVSKTGCLTLSVSPAIYNLNYLSYVSPLTALTIDSGDVSFGRYDEVIADSFGLVSVLKGTPSATPSAVQLNPSSQVLLSTIFIPANATCLDAVYISTIYDQNYNTEYTVTKSGTITEDTANLNNPYHLTKGLFVSSYTDGSQLIFTKPSGVDTVFSSSVFIIPTYLNNAFTNQFQIQFWNNDTAVSQNIIANPFLNPLDSNQYQIVSIPFQYFNFTGTYFNKIIITHGGYDTSGTKGYYFDWIRVQHGITNTTTIRYVDSTKIIAGNEYYYIGGIAYLAGAVGSSGSSITLKTNGVDNGSQSILNLKDGTNTTIVDDGVGGITISSTATSGLTFDSTITSTAGQTAFTFSTATIPSSTKTIFIEVNGIDWLPTTGYTRTSSTVITLTASDLVVGDKVRLRY